MVGVLLPPSIPGALVNLAAMLMGKVPVNLNYTASNETLASCAEQCNLKTVITARAFLERVHVQPPAETVFLEDLAEKPGFGERLGAALACLLPARSIAKVRRLPSTRRGSTTSPRLFFPAAQPANPKA